MRWLRSPITAAMTIVNRLRGLLPAFLRRPGVIGIAFTPNGRIVLVRHTYVGGWYPPGGARKRKEPGIAAVIRELEEEIGLQSWASVEPLEEHDKDLAVYVLRNVVYHAGWSLEIAAVSEFDLSALPPDVSPRLLRLLTKSDLRLAIRSA